MLKTWLTCVQRKEEAWYETWIKQGGRREVGNELWVITNSLSLKEGLFFFLFEIADLRKFLNSESSNFRYLLYDNISGSLGQRHKYQEDRQKRNMR